MIDTVTRALFLCILVSICVSPALAQSREVTGTVRDASTGDAMPGVNIAVRGTNTGTTTDMEGRYAITVPGPETVLVFSFIGYETQEITVGDRSVIDVTLEEGILLTGEVVVVGYGTQRREDVTGSVAVVNADDANVGLITSPDQLLQGRVAGVSVTANNGEPGAGLNVRIRGGTSISASNEPLYVVDGVPIDNAQITPGGSGIEGSTPPPTRNPLAMINPNDIQSITVLKDASATAIYGSRGANGVVLIETKQGVAGRVTVDYEAYTALASPYRKLDVLSGDEYRAFIQREVNAGRLPQSRLDALGQANTDWEEEVTRSAVSQFHNLSMAGGNNATQYRASVSFMDQEGVIISSGLKRITGRINADHQTLDDRLRLGLNLTSTYTDDDYVYYENTGGFEGTLFTNTLGFNPTFPVRAAEGQFYEVGAGPQGVRNPVAIAEQIEDGSKTTRTMGNLSAALDLFGGLTAQVNFGADRAQSTRRTFFPRASPIGATFGGRATQKQREHTTYTLQTYLTLNRNLAANHRLDLLGGYEFNEYLTQEFGAEARNFISDVFSFDALETGTPYPGSGSGTSKGGTYSFTAKSRLISFFGRANYNIGDRYYLTGVLRYDGSSRFGAGNKWALFPAISGAWRLSEEPFLRGVEALSDLRLKVGYGIVGSQEIDPYRSLALLGADPANQAVIGGEVRPGVAPTQYANPNLQWEETATFNVGLDYGFANGRYSGSIEYYVKNTDNLLLEVTVPQPAVVSTRLENIGSVRNQGIDLSLDALVIDRSNLSLMLGAVFNTNQNEVVDLGGRDQIPMGVVQGRGQSDTRAQMIFPGEPLYTFYGPVFLYVDENGDQVFRDFDEAGNEIGTTTTPGAEDRQIIGNAQPDFTYGLRASLNWGRFDASIFFRGEQGRDLLNNTALVYQTKNAVLQGQNFLKAALDDPDSISEAGIYSSRWVEDASFLRLDNVTLGYTFDVNRLTSRVREARVYLSLQNVFVLTGYSGYDPEVNTTTTFNGINSVGIDYLNYPRPRTVTLGVHLGF